jgi:hypothetical protein
MERDDDSKKSHRALAARAGIPPPAIDYSAVRCAAPSLPQSASLLRRERRACIDKTLFTITDIDEGFFGLSDFTDQRVNLWVARADQCGTDAQ